MQISRHFKRAEFQCKCGCGYNTVDAELITILEDVRSHFKKPVRINSGARCFKHNASEGGRPTSQHLIGRAADITVEGVIPIVVYNYLNTKHPSEYGLGNYETFTHIDSRSTRARW
jgi:uncharacterized protein YcbK (DUF882 family)